MAAAVTLVAALELLAAVVLVIALGWSWSIALDSFMITNSVMGTAFAVCGAILAWQRPRNAIGWLFLAAAIAQSMAAVCAPLAVLLHENDAPTVAVRVVTTLFMWSWPWSIGLFLILALLLFPDGRLPSRRWRPALIGILVTSPLFAVELGSEPTPLTVGYPIGYLTIAAHDQLGPLWTISELRNLVAYLISLAALVVRFRRGDARTRQQLLWLLLALLIMMIASVPWAFVAGTPVIVLLAIPLIPAAVVVAIIRYRLLDIRVVASRLLTWVVLSLAVLLSYLALIAVLDRYVAAWLGRSAMITAVLVVLAALVLPRLQRIVDRLVYGDRQDPAVIMSRLGERLAETDGGLDGVIIAIRSALRLPYAAVLRPDGKPYETGERPETIGRRTLLHNGIEVGELIIGLRPGERSISRADRRVLSALSAPLALALHTSALTEELQSSRSRIVSAREEERRRLRRELHDGLGPTLTGIAYSADAVGNLLGRDQQAAEELITSVRRDARHAIADIRRLAEDLRPSALDELGLYAALRMRTGRLNRRADGMPVRVVLELPPGDPPLPAAVEIAAYRIVIEALTNALRHSSADTVVINIEISDVVTVMITDNGPLSTQWLPGVGIQSMGERAAELNGTFASGPTEHGGRVLASFPLEAA